MLRTRSKLLGNYEPEDFICKDHLNKIETSHIWLICILSPVLGGAIIYWGWKKRIPMKARAANKISVLAFILVLMLYSLYAMITS